MKLRDALRAAFMDYGEVIASIEAFGVPDDEEEDNDWNYVWPNVERLLAEVPDELETELEGNVREIWEDAP